MNTTQVDKVWFAVVDSRQGRLFEMTRTEHGRLHLEERDKLAEVWEEKEHHRPSMMAADGRTHASFRHEGEERIRRFARSATEWLVEQAKARHIEHVMVFCALPILGPMRHHHGKELARFAELRAEDLAWLTPSELTAHPAVTGLLP